MRSTRRLAGAPHPLLGRGSVHASLIAGGEELSTYPSRCVLSLERRTLPGEDGGDVSALIEGVDASARTLLVREPFAVDPEAEIVALVREAAGGAPLAGAPYWTDAAFIAAAGIPTVLFGPGGEGAHAVEEWVSIADTERGRARAGRRGRENGGMRAFSNPAYAPAAVPAPVDDALAFHRGLAGYAPTPLRDLGDGVWLKDESNRLGLPAFKVLGASWAVERALREDPSRAHAGGGQRGQPRPRGRARRRAARAALPRLPARRARSRPGARRSRARAPRS